MSRRQSEEVDGIPLLFREAADSVGHLVVAHIKVANLEFVADLDARAKRLGLQLAIGMATLLGYVFLMIGVALAAMATVGRPMAFVLVGLFHFLAAAVGAAVIGLRRQRPPMVSQMIDSLTQSATTAADAVILPKKVSQSLEKPHGRS